MKSRVPDILEKARVKERDPRMDCPGDWYGRFIIKCPVTGAMLVLVVSGSDEWESVFPPPAFEHVSVSVRPEGRPLAMPPSVLPRSDQYRCPTWEEMCWVKDLCWDAEECVVQYHPPKSMYVNHHPGCLHLWKVVGAPFPVPPKGAIA